MSTDPAPSAEDWDGRPRCDGRVLPIRSDEQALWSQSLRIMSIAARIRERREKVGITQAELGRRISASRFTICKWEAGVRNPDHQFWAPIIREIGLTVADLSPDLATASEPAPEHQGAA